MNRNNYGYWCNISYKQIDFLKFLRYTKNALEQNGGIVKKAGDLCIFRDNYRGRSCVVFAIIAVK